MYCIKPSAYTYATITLAGRVSICSEDSADSFSSSKSCLAYMIWIDCNAGSATSVAAGRLSYSFGLKAACISIDTACSSSLVATHIGARELNAGSATRALVSGVNLTLSPSKTAMFGVTGEIAFDAAASHLTDLI